MGLKQMDEFRQDAACIALTSGLTRKHVDLSPLDLMWRLLNFLKERTNAKEPLLRRRFSG